MMVMMAAASFALSDPARYFAAIAMKMQHLATIRMLGNAGIVLLDTAAHFLIFVETLAAPLQAVEMVEMMGAEEAVVEEQQHTMQAAAAATVPTALIPIEDQATAYAMAIIRHA